MKITFIMLILVPLLFGCSGLPLAERQNNATTEVSEAWSRNQKEAIKVAIGAVSQTQQPATIEWNANNTETGNGDQSLATKLEQSIPGGLKMIYLALGIGALVWVVGTVRRSSQTANVILGAADRGFANVINHVESKMHSSATPEEKASHASILSVLEKARGQATRRI